MTQIRLPDHLILQNILPRLPVTSLFRFKSVCKDWYHTISSNNFAKTHLKYSSDFSQQSLLLANDFESYNYVFYLLDYEEQRRNLKEVVYPSSFDSGLHGVVDIVGCCNGLVCLYREFNQHRTFYVWNPATRQSREIDQIIRLEEIEPFMFTAAYAFGYASTIDDYKIVVVFTSYTDEFKSHLYVYSLESAKWERIECIIDDYRVSTIGIHKGVVIDDRVYWPLRFRDHGQQSNGIVEFSLVGEELKVKPWMGWLSQENEVNNLPLVSIQGCLSLCRYRDDTCVEVWILKNRDDWDCWEILFDLNVGLVDFFHLYKKSCLLHHLNQLKVIEQVSEGDAGFAINYNGHIWEVGDYVESFVSPFHQSNSLISRRCWFCC